MTGGIFAAILLAAGQMAAPCSGGRPETGDVGIRGLRCAGPAASCEINVTRDADDLPRHVFAVEPVVTSVDAGARDLRAGDTLVAVDGILITTAAGGRRLARLPIGAAVTLLVRRDAALVDVRTTARAGCGVSSLQVTR